jgi:hypothetical protein
MLMMMEVSDDFRASTSYQNMVSMESQQTCGALRCDVSRTPFF